MVDEVSNWACTSPVKLVPKHKIHILNLFKPTDAISQTTNASRQKMEAVGYITAEITFGNKSTTGNVFAFK